MSSLFSDFLSALGVRHTADYSDNRFAGMPFQSMFGLSALLSDYGVSSTGVIIDEEDKADALQRLPLPFLADTPSGFIIVKNVTGENVCYTSESQDFTVPVTEMLAGWNGIALLAKADEKSAEPEYARHRIGEASKKVKAWVLVALLVILISYAMRESGLYTSAAAWCLVLFNCMGLWFSWQLVQKSLGIKNKAGDAVCSALEEGGCDEIARSEAASFMGIFKWSEVGLCYFSVSLGALLLFPKLMPVLAAVNILCLPYTVWSIWYQRFKAKTWCTLCVCVQATLWLLFFGYLLDGATRQILPLSGSFIIDFIALGCCYVAVLLGLNRLDDALLKLLKTSDNDTTANS